MNSQSAFTIKSLNDENVGDPAQGDGGSHSGGWVLCGLMIVLVRQNKKLRNA